MSPDLSGRYACRSTKHSSKDAARAWAQRAYQGLIALFQPGLSAGAMMERTMTEGKGEDSKEEEQADSKPKEDRREGKAEHEAKLREIRMAKVREVETEYLERLRAARQQYFETRKQAEANKRSMFEPSMQMLNLFGGFQRPPTSCRNARKSKFWDDDEDKDVKETDEDKHQEVETPLTKEQIEQEVDRLKTRAMEVEAVLRVQFDAEDCVEVCRSKLTQCSDFYESLQKLASQLNVLKGAAFQELLGRGSGHPRGHINRDRCRVTGLVKVEAVFADEAELQSMILGAEALCDLVRVKIEDDNDLGLALSVVDDSSDFLIEMARIAKVEGEDEFSFLQTLRTF